MKVLVTGGAGYVGSHAVLALVDAGVEVVVVDSLENGRREVLDPLDAVELVEGDIGNAALMRSVLNESDIDVVMHFAAYAYVGESVHAPAKYYRNNVSAMITLLDEMVAAGITSMVFSSSCATYGTPGEIPIGEETRQEPINPYGKTKLFGERLLHDYGVAYGMKSIIFRYFNAAGADPSGRSGETHVPETHLIPLALDAAMGRREHLSIFGTDYDTPDGTCVRDYIHVADLAAAHLLGSRHLMDHARSDRINLGVGRGYSVHEVVDSVERITQKKVPVIHEQRRAGDPPALIADAAKAERVLGWIPDHTSLDTIIAHAWQWHQKIYG